MARFLFHLASFAAIPALEIISFFSQPVANWLAHRSILSASIDRQMGRRLF